MDATLQTNDATGLMQEGKKGKGEKWKKGRIDVETPRLILVLPYPIFPPFPFFLPYTAIHSAERLPMNMFGAVFSAACEEGSPPEMVWAA
ncbi:MAG: hypothetical protein RBS80_15450 [Thermoguttaceae bacterium]|jgi:hypothetical protein|nr:hypothetical protein [Thermoguttaceae bacterium]